jgi:hypothetical protein
MPIVILIQSFAGAARASRRSSLWNSYNISDDLVSNSYAIGDT